MSSLFHLIASLSLSLGPSPLLLPYLVIAPSNSGEPNISQKPSTFHSKTKHLPFLSNILNSKPKEYNKGYWLGGRPSAAVPPESARKRADSARFRADPPDVRQTFGRNRRTPRGYGRIRAESPANWRKSSLEKCPPTTTYLTPLLLAEKLPRRTTVRRGNISRVRVRVRVGVRV